MPVAQTLFRRDDPTSPHGNYGTTNQTFLEALRVSGVSVSQLVCFELNI